MTENASLDYNSKRKTFRFSSWALPGSLAVTRGILVSFFSILSELRSKGEAFLGTLFDEEKSE